MAKAGLEVCGRKEEAAVLAVEEEEEAEELWGW